VSKSAAFLALQPSRIDLRAPVCGRLGEPFFACDAPDVANSRDPLLWTLQRIVPIVMLVVNVATYLPLANTGLSIVPLTWNGKDSLPSFSVAPDNRANRFVTNPCLEAISATPW
jgi:hypothetical protein